MLFLPASFYTSVFGMQSILLLSTSLRIFAIVMGGVCGATYLTIVFRILRGQWRERKGSTHVSPDPGQVEAQNRSDISVEDQQRSKSLAASNETSGIDTKKP